MTTLNETHDPALRSWVESANATNATESEFPIQNLPLAVFRRRGRREAFRGGVAIGAQIVDMAERGALDVDRSPPSRPPPHPHGVVDAAVMRPSRGRGWPPS